MKKSTAKLLNDLRALMRQLPNNGGSINAYVIPTDDSHQSEYISPTDERRSFITGFTGSAGTAVVTQKEALLWTDGRYHQQAEQQLDANWTLMKDGLSATPSINNWLCEHLSAGDRVGVDGNLLSFRVWSPMQSALSSNGKCFDDNSSPKNCPLDQNIKRDYWLFHFRYRVEID